MSLEASRSLLSSAQSTALPVLSLCCPDDASCQERVARATAYLRGDHVPERVDAVIGREDDSMLSMVLSFTVVGSNL